MPPASAVYHSAVQTAHATDYDSQNIFYWDYAVNRGELPYRDFWYPYSGMYDEALPLAPYLAYAWIARLLVFGVTAMSLYVCVGKSRTASIAIWAAVILMDSAHLFWPGAVWRYLLAASLALLACAAVQERSRWMAAGVGFWTVYLISEEISQAIYAAPALALVLVAGLWMNRARLREYVQVVLTACGALIVASSCYFGLLAYRGQFNGWVAFLRELPLMGVYAGWPLDVATLLGIPRNMQQLYLLTLVLLLVAGAIQAVASRFESAALLAPLCLGLVCVMQFQKEMIRPGIATQLLPICALGLGILVAQQTIAAKRPRIAMLAGSYAAALIITLFFVMEAPLRAELIGRANIVSGAGMNLAYTFGHHDEWAEARRKFFSPELLTYGGTTGTGFRSQIESATQLKAADDVFVLGDRADLYVLLQKPAPYYITFYNQSPLAAQSRTVDWLKAHRPAYVLWNASAREFDQIPNVVRVPLLYRYVVAHYVSSGAVGPFELLRRRKPDEALDLQYWRKLLGDFESLGYIPALSHAEASCSSTGPIHDHYLLVDITSPVAERDRAIPLQIDSEPFTVHFKEMAGTSHYSINLERLPWAGIPTLGPNQPAGASARVTTLTFDREPLY